MLWPETAGRPSWKRRLWTQLRLFSKTCGAMIADPTDITTPPSRPSTAPAKVRKSDAAVRPMAAPLNIGWHEMMS